MQQDNDKPSDQQATQAAASGMEWMNEQREVRTEQEQSEYEASWFDASLRADHFFRLKSVTPVWAAKLLCGLNPNKVSDEDALKTTTEEITPDDYTVLLQTFQDGPSACSLLEWMRVADEAGCKVHPWAAKYAKHRGLSVSPAPEASPAPAAPPPVPLVVNVNLVSVTQPPAPAPEQAPTAPDPATAPEPAKKETPEERRARWLEMFEAEKKRQPRGALQRLADREGVDRSNMAKDIGKARGARDEQKRAGMWTSQLVQDGKRTR